MGDGMTMKRRKFVKQGLGGAALWMLGPTLFREQTSAQASTVINNQELSFSSSSIQAQLSRSGPEFASLTIDCLGKSKRSNSIFQTSTAISGYEATAKPGNPQTAEYRMTGQKTDVLPAWTVEFSDCKIVLSSQWVEGSLMEPFIFLQSVTVPFWAC
jgi:hypothetical protein